MGAVTSEAPLLLSLDLAGTFVFALNGAMTALRLAKLDVVGVVSLAMVTGLGGGIIRDVLIGAVPPATFRDWRYLVVAAGGGLTAFVLNRPLNRFVLSITMLDAAGLGLFAVTGSSKAVAFGLGIGQATILGAITGVGGGTLRDVLIRRIPTVLYTGLYAIPALIGAAITAGTVRAGVYGVPAAIGAASTCFVVRMLGVHFNLNAPLPPGMAPRPGADEAEGDSA